MRDIYYEHFGGSLYLRSRAKTPGGSDQSLDMVDRVSELAFAYHLEGGTLLKHGRRALVEEWVAKYRGLFPEEKIAVVVFEDATDVEELNRAINTAGYIQGLVERLKPAQLPPPGEPPT